MALFLQLGKTLLTNGTKYKTSQIRNQLNQEKLCAATEVQMPAATKKAKASTAVRRRQAFLQGSRRSDFSVRLPPCSSAFKNATN